MALPIRIELPEGFLDEEVRCGYVVTRKLKQIWAVELDLYKEFERICRKYDIDFSICWGSVLGAVRHGGFIPWDDDLDVIVDRKGFKKLLKVPRSEYGGNYFLQTALSEENHYQHQARLRNSLTTAHIRGSSPCVNNGIFLDIYVLDGVAPNRFWLSVHAVLKHIALLPLKSYWAHGNLLARLVPFRVWWWIYCRVVSMFTPFVDKIGPADSFKPEDHLEYWISKKDFADCEDVPYEFTTVRSFRNRIPFLKRRYGNYMEFPPLEERGKWHEGVIHFEPEVPYEDYFKSKAAGGTHDNT